MLHVDLHGLTMFAAGGERAESAPKPGPEALTYDPHDWWITRPEKTTSPLHINFLAQRLTQQLQSRERSPSPKSPLTPEVVLQSVSSPQEPRTSQKRKPRHVPIEITPMVISSVLKGLPPSPKSPNQTPEPQTAAQELGGGAEDVQRPKRVPRPRHIPIVIPCFAQPQIDFPPTPSTSAGTTPRASPKPHSCELLYSAMSRPNTSGSRSSTVESSHSGPSPSQGYTSRFMNGSSESSLNQPSHDLYSTHLAAPGAAPTATARTMNVTEPMAASDDNSPSVATSSQPSATATTNLSGLVCNVHKCSGREPLARVGATTTILGDKLYVFGGRVLSRKHSMKVTSEMYELDLIRRHWTKVETSGPTPKPRYFHTTCGLGDSKLVCYGGMSPAPLSRDGVSESSQPGSDPMENMMVMSDIHVYDTIKRSWTHLATQDTPPGRYAHCAAVVPSSAVFTSANAPLSAILHNPPSSIPNQGTLGVALDGSGGAEMIVVGGQDSHNKYIDAISVFNLRSLKWTDTKSLERSCGAYRSVVTPLTCMSAAKIGAGSEGEENTGPAANEVDRSDPIASMLIYSNYNFLDVKLELQARLPDGSLLEKEMKGPVSPPGLRFPSGDILDHHFIVSGTYLTSSKHEYALWALDLRTLTWSRIDAGGGIFSQGSWNRGILWSRRNTFVILGNRKRVLVDDYNRRRINFSNICMVELEAYGLYDNPRRVWPTSDYTSISAPILPAAPALKTSNLGGRSLPPAAVDLGLIAMNLREVSDMELLAINGERLPVNSYILARRWGPYFNQLLRESSSSLAMQNDASSSSDGGTLRLNHLQPSSIASRNSSITITPSINTVTSNTNSSVTVTSNTSLYGPSFNPLDATSAQNPVPFSRPRQLYLPHTILTLRALIQYLYTSSLPSPDHELCTPQILCSLLQIARPYRIDGLLEATVERLHEVLDGRNAAAVFNAAAMAAGGGRGTAAPFSREGDLDLAGTEEPQGGGQTLTRVQQQPGRGRRTSSAANRSHAPTGVASESEDDSESASAASSSNNNTATSRSASESASEADSDSMVNNRRPSTAASAVAVGASDETWAGGVSCVVGLQKRGLRGLMEGRRMREREKGRAVGGLGGTEVNGASTANHNHVGSGSGGSGAGAGAGGVGLGIV